MVLSVPQIKMLKRSPPGTAGAMMSVTQSTLPKVIAASMPQSQLGPCSASPLPLIFWSRMQYADCGVLLDKGDLDCNGYVLLSFYVYSYCS